MALRNIRRQNLKTIEDYSCENRVRFCFALLPFYRIVFGRLFWIFYSRIRRYGFRNSRLFRCACQAIKRKKRRQRGVSGGNNIVLYRILNFKCTFNIRSAQSVITVHSRTFYETAWYSDRGRRAFLRSKTHHDSGLKIHRVISFGNLNKSFKFLIDLGLNIWNRRVFHSKTDTNRTDYVVSIRKYCHFRQVENVNFNRKTRPRWYVDIGFSQDW